MSIAARKERQRAELRGQILDAARALVLTEGYEQLSMRKIAEAIEYSAATIYSHFASRDEIALELVREGFAQLLETLAPAAAIADPLERLREIARRYVRFGLEHAETYRLIFMENPKFSSPVIAQALDQPDEPGAANFALLETAVAELVRAGTFAPVEPETGAYLLWSALHGVVSLKLACGDGHGFAIDAETLTRQMLAVLERGFR